jgi:DNA-directed RNA polymerase specialized sigma24 family protein
MIDNGKLGILLFDYNEKRADYEWSQENGLFCPYPKFPDEVAEAFLNLACKIGNRANFRGYGFREDMIGDAVLTCLLYSKNFDPAKGSFRSYFGRVCWNAFVKRINREARESEKCQKARDLAKRYNLVGVKIEIEFEDEAAA